MPRKITTLMLDNVACVGGAARTIEKALRNVPGVLHAYVNPATEAAYVEYDTDQCSERDLDAAVRLAGTYVVHPTVPQRPTVVPVAFLSRGFPMRQIGTGHRTWWAFAGFTVIAGFVLLAEHRAHLLGAIPFLFLLACLLLHRFGHGGHGAHERHAMQDGYAATLQEGIARDRDLSARARNHYQPSHGHRHVPAAPYDDWRGQRSP